MASAASTPIKRYNYERSAYRWLLQRHPRQFEKEGLTSTALERAPVARKALFHTSWSGSKKLVRCVEGRYERTVFFDTFIKRGLGFGTRFAIEHLTPQERQILGICEDPTGKVYLAHYGIAPQVEPELNGADGGGVCVPGCAAPRRRCAAHSEMSRKLWHTIAGLVGPELEGQPSQRQVTVTKAVKAMGARVITQVVIEIADADTSSSSALPPWDPSLQLAAAADAFRGISPSPTRTAMPIPPDAAPARKRARSEGPEAAAVAAAAHSAAWQLPQQPQVAHEPAVTTLAGGDACGVDVKMDFHKIAAAASAAAVVGAASASQAAPDGGGGSCGGGSSGSSGGGSSGSSGGGSSSSGGGGHYGGGESGGDLAHWADAKLLDDLDVDILSSLF
ncbi:hypothetical protein JKP88DRAFT_286631 [Tribonema minus]|uniref:Uncharacterized protein n=1 Tax=Tribonema minus TaxID=303371 RepID=A0A835Z9J0_9STRA|nr:hypothetical protein JKP88DRAFT_286631 [Tribonema minus]